MNWGRIFGGLIFGLSVVAAVGYFVARDWRHGLYWICAAGCTFIATYLF